MPLLAPSPVGGGTHDSALAQDAQMNAAFLDNAGRAFERFESEVMRASAVEPATIAILEEMRDAIEDCIVPSTVEDSGKAGNGAPRMDRNNANLP